MVTMAVPSPGLTAKERGQIELLMQRLKERIEDDRDLYTYAARVLGYAPDMKKRP